MKPGVPESVVAPKSGSTRTVCISKWVNEPPPSWDQILTAHDVARLTRRPKWVLSALTLLRQFPKKERFHGRNLGWRLPDIEEWLARSRKPRSGDLRSARYLRRRSAPPPAQMCLWCRSSHCRMPGGVSLVGVTHERRTARRRTR